MEPKVEAMRRPNCHRSAAWGPALALPYRADINKRVGLRNWCCLAGACRRM